MNRIINCYIENLRKLRSECACYGHVLEVDIHTSDLVGGMAMLPRDLHKETRVAARAIWPSWPDVLRMIERGNVEKALARRRDRLCPGLARRRWGSYYERLAADDGKGGILVLSRTRGMNKWKNRVECSFYTNVSCSNVRCAWHDSVRPSNLPCLQYIQFVRTGEFVNMYAIYRSQEYKAKALGNMFGLGSLLATVAHMVDLRPGKLVIFAIRAWWDGSRKQLCERLAILDRIVSPASAV